MVQDYDTGRTFRRLGTRTDTGTLFGRTMGLVAVTIGLFTLGCLPRPQPVQRVGDGVLDRIVRVPARHERHRAPVRAAHAGVPVRLWLAGGLATAPTISYYTNVDPEPVWEAGGATALFVAGFGTGGYATRRDLSALARVLCWALIALIAFGVVLIFVSILGSSVAYALLGLVTAQTEPRTTPRT
jgi:uncharacterized protein